MTDGEFLPGGEQSLEVFSGLHAAAPDEASDAVPWQGGGDLGPRDKIVDEAHPVRRQSVKRGEFLGEGRIDAHDPIEAPIDKGDERTQLQHQLIIRIADDVGVAERDLAIGAARERADQIRTPQIADRDVDAQLAFQTPQPPGRDEIFERAQGQRQARNGSQRMKGRAVLEPSSSAGRIERGLVNFRARQGQRPRQQVDHALGAAGLRHGGQEKEDAGHCARAAAPAVAPGLAPAF